MKRIIPLLTIVMFAIPSVNAGVNFSVKENISFDGKIATVKTSKKFRNVEACQKLCESRNSCAAFVLNTKAGSCTILKSVTDEDAKEGVTSGAKS